MSFKTNDKVIGTHPALGGSYKGVVLFDNLIGNHPLLVKFNIDGSDTCVQLDATGSGMLRLDSTPVGIRCVSYLFSDGTATPFKPADEHRPFSRVTVGAMTADRLEDGTYTNHKFRSFMDEADGIVDDTEVVATRAIAIPLDGSEMQSLDGQDIPPEVRDMLDKLFGKFRNKK